MSHGGDSAPEPTERSADHPEPIPTAVYLLGAGVRGVLHLTRETEQALRICQTVFVLHADAAVLDDVRDLGPEVVDLAPLYAGRTVRDDVYRDISAGLVRTALEAPPVALLVHGHPLFLVSAAEYTLDLAAEHGLGVSTLPAVSSFDTLLCDLGIDYGYGVQMFDTTTMLRAGWVPDSRIPLLLFQLASTLDPSVIDGEPCPAVLGPVRDLLVDVYGADHGAILVWSSTHALESSSLTTVAVSDLANRDLELWRRPTLYVPAI